MLCPHCKTPLSIAERSNIEIDFCPTCRGVWLDRGELDKLIERAAASNPVAAEHRTPRFTAESRPFPQDAYEQEHHRWGRHGHGKHPRKKSFLSEIFDFD